MNAKTRIHQIAIDAWTAGATLLSICLILETLERGFVSRFFNLLWLLLLTVAATVAVMATHPGPASAGAQHRYGDKLRVLLQLGSVAAAAAAWFLLPSGLSLLWRGLAVAATLLTALVAWPALSKNE